MIDINKLVQPIEENLEQKQYEGRNMYGAPQAAMTAPDATTLTSSGGTGTHVDESAIAVINNLRTRVNELEDRIVKLSLIKSR